MTTAVAIVSVVVGLVLLIVASERFVSGAAGISFRMKVPAIVVGAVVIGFGTSTPELLVSILAAADDSLDIAMGNVVGSNLANFTLVLGVVALVAAPRITSRVLRREVPVTVAAMVALTVLIQPLTRTGGLILLALFVVALVAVLVVARSGDDPLGTEADRELQDQAARSWPALAFLTVGGVVGTLVGAQLLVSGAQDLAADLGLAEGFVGFTLVAVGTSLPEVVTGVHAARRGEPDLAVGNVLGSNVFNSLLVAGAAGVVGPGAVASGLVSAAWVMTAMGFVVWFLMATSNRLVRWEAILLLAAYAATIPLVL